MSKGRIERVDPAAAIPGGEVAVECTDYDTSNLRACRALFDGAEARMVGASPRRVLAIVPETSEGGAGVEVVLEGGDGQRTDSARLAVGRKLAEDLHLVANPAVRPRRRLALRHALRLARPADAGLASCASTRAASCTACTARSPTRRAWPSTARGRCSSRAAWTARSTALTPFHEVVAFARNLGVATGLAFDRYDRMYVGDRTGTIHRVNGVGEADAWALLEPSVAAYHMAFGPDGGLYVTGPTVSSFDSVTRVDEDGRTSVFFAASGARKG